MALLAPGCDKFRMLPLARPTILAAPISDLSPLADFEVIEAQLVAGGPEGEAWRRCQLALMGDVSNFMKLLKQRFAIWFNKAHRRFGTLFAERFKSVLVECSGNALRTMAFYIDLNPVRAGLVADPKDYRFCGYGEAVAGNAAARAGLCWVHAVK